MEKLPMCRICLVQNVRMFVVVNRNLRELYEKLTDIPFLTEDSRPILACFICFTKLKQCYRLLRQCLEAEELFAQKMNETNPLINQDHFEFYSGFIKSPTENISLVDEFQTESICIKDELPAVCEGFNYIIEPKEEYLSDELELEKSENSCINVADIPLQHSESEFRYYVPLTEFKAQVKQEQELSNKEYRTRETKRTTVVKKPTLEIRRTELEDAETAEQKKLEKSDSKVFRASQKRTSKPGTCFKESYKSDQGSLNRVKKKIQHSRTHVIEKPYKCNVCQRSFSQNCHLLRHIRIHTDEKPFKCDECQRCFSQKGHLFQHIRIHTGEKPYNCDVCQRSFSVKSSLTRHIRVHTFEKPYKCDLCQRSYSEKSVLIKHIRIHTGEKPHKCDVCQRSFSEKSHLTRHIRIHTGEDLQIHYPQK